MSHVVLAWPESCENAETLTQILQDANKDAQRLLIPLSPAPSRDLTDRYARRGVVAGPFAAQTPTKSTAPVQYVITAWNARSSALQNALEMLDPAGAVIWTADGASAEEVRAALPVAGETTVVTGDAPAAELIICYDIPEPARLAQLSAAGNVALLLPPHALPTSSW